MSMCSWPIARPAHWQRSKPPPPFRLWPIRGIPSPLGSWPASPVPAFFFAEICAKRVELIKEAISTLTRVAVFVNPANPSHALALAAMQRTASALGVELVSIEVKARDDIAVAIAMVATRRAPALVDIEDPLFISNARQIAGLALHSRLPMIGFKPQAEAGALMDYGVDLTDNYS